jgi:benzoyl-CoA reductase/2-hydroxyglutaryl-CoA dehydratase subunit BcrC/BadD/HgdB
MRKAYLEKQKREHGRKVLGVLPIHYPKPLLTAMNVLAVEIWGPPGPPRGPAAQRLQTYVCAIARNALAFIASGGADGVDGFLYPHTCDSIQGLATLIPDFGGSAKPALRFQHPRGEDRKSARAFVLAELRALAGALAQLTGEPLAPGRLRWALRLHQEIDHLRGALLGARARLPLDDLAFYELLRRGEYLWPEDHLRELRETCARLGPDPVQTRVPLLVTGYVPEPMALLRHLNDAGAYLAADDYAAVGRRVPRGSPIPRDDPFEELVEHFFALPPCPTRSASLARRLEHLSQLWQESGAAGVILHTVKFCEPELFDVPGIREHFARLRVPVLQIESELEAGLSGATLTRIEAFGEMVAGSRRGS